MRNHAGTHKQTQDTRIRHGPSGSWTSQSAASPLNYLGISFFILAGRLRFHLLLPFTWNLFMSSYKYHLPNQVPPKSNPITNLFTRPEPDGHSHLQHTDLSLYDCQDGLQKRLRPNGNTQDATQDTDQEAQAVIWPQDRLQHSVQQASREPIT